jgi:hypothetical protein
MFEILVGANALQGPPPRKFADGETEDRYYRSHEPPRRRSRGLAPLVALVGLAAIVIGLVPH